MNRWIVAFCCLCVSITAFANNSVYVYSKGKIVCIQKADNVDSVAVEESKIVMLNAQKREVFSSSQLDVDSITFDYELPQADLLNVCFKEDGSAVDLSPMNLKIEGVNINGLNAYPYSSHDHYAVRFDNKKGSAPTSFYKINYYGNNAFKKALSDGHSFEAVFMMTETPYSASSSEAKFFSSHQAGGTGFSILRGKIYFLPNISKTGSSKYIEVNSEVQPQANQFYHVVGVWDKEQKIASVYVNGELKASLPADGELIYGSSTAQWFGIGCDANNSNGEMSWNGDVSIARIYDNPLTENDVKVLYHNYLQEQEDYPNLVDDVEYFTGLPVKANQNYEFVGKGFLSSDYIKLVPIGKGSSILRKISILGTDTAQIKIPASIASGVYKVELIRKNSSQLLGFDSIVVVDKMPKVFEANFHRGLWNVPGSAQNSRASLQGAINMNAFSSEIDIWLTVDDSLMVNHDASLNGVTIQTSTYEEVKDLTLVNGEKIPKLRDLLEILKKSTGTRLVIETKKHSSTSRSIEASRAAMDMVEAMGLKDRVEYVSFSLDVCKDQMQKEPTAIVSYINGDKSPEQLYPFGINLDYTPAVYKSHPQWIPTAHSLGLTCISWTLNTRADIIDSANLEADFLASDYPWWVQKIREYYLRHQDK